MLLHFHSRAGLVQRNPAVEPIVGDERASRVDRMALDARREAAVGFLLDIGRREREENVSRVIVARMVDIHRREVV